MKEIVKVSPVNFSDEETAVDKIYTKKELSLLYQISINTLNAWIKRSLIQFQELGYVKYQKKLTKAQIRLCFQLWGEP